MIKLTYYPGCSLKSSANFYDKSLVRVLSHYGIELKEIEGWLCCGAAAAPTVSDELSLILSGRNIALSEEIGLPVVIPCSACYSRMKRTIACLSENNGIRDNVNRAIAPLTSRGSLELKNIVEVFLKYVGIERIAESRVYDLGPLRFVSYYGCLLTRIPGVPPTDDIEDPLGMDTVIRSLGGSVISWQYKTECCGAASTITDEQKTARQSGKLLIEAHRAGADCVVTTCPLCHLNLDLTFHLRKDITPVPVFFLSEIFELALFGTIPARERHIIPVHDIENRINKGIAKSSQ